MFRDYLEKTVAKMEMHALSRAWRYHSRYFDRLWGDKGMSELTAEVIDAWALKRRKERAAATVVKELSFVRAVFRTAKKPWPGEELTPIRVNNKRLPSWSPEHEAQFKRRLAKEAYDTMRFAILTGLRRREQFSLRPEDVDFRNRSIHIVTTKTGEGCHHPVGSEALSILRRRIAAMKKSDVYIFGSQCENRIEAGQNFVQKKWKPVSNIVMGKDRLRWHDLRHWHASIVANTEKDLFVVKESLRHKDIHSTMRYAHLCNKRLRSALDRLS